jgi:hypothetical protein
MRIVSLVTAAGVLLPLAATAVTFTDVTRDAGVDYRQRAEPFPSAPTPQVAAKATGGAAATDCDGDGWPDVVATRLDAPPILFRNQHDGTFADATSSAGALAASVPVGSNGVGSADIDNDGDQDLYVTAVGPNRFFLFINDGHCVFTEEGLERGAALATAYPHYGMGIAFGDYDRDGWLDVFTAEWRANPLPPDAPLPGPSRNRLLRNRGSTAPGWFDDVTEAAGVQIDAPPDLLTNALGVPGFSPGFVDFDGDGWSDLTWVADWGHSRLFWNAGNGTFVDGTVAAHVGLERSGMGSTYADFDGDGRLDWFTTSIYGRTDEIPFGVSNQLYLNDGARTFRNVTATAGIADGGFGWGASAFDFDHDGDVDIAHTNGFLEPGHPEEARWRFDRTRLFENAGDGTFSDVALARGITDAGLGRALFSFDYDRDGDRDLFVANHGGGPVLYRNDGGNAQHWLELVLAGTASNRDGIGAIVTIDADGPGPRRPVRRDRLANSNYVSQDEGVVHVGLGDHAGPVAQVTVGWPSGDEDVLAHVPADMRLTVTEGSGVRLPSCIPTGRSRLRLAPARDDAAARALRWTATVSGTRADLGDPISSPGYRLVLTDATGVRVDVALDSGSDHWTRSRRGYRYTAGADAPGGIERVHVRTARRSGTLRIRISGRTVPVERAAVDLVPPLRVRLSVSVDRCWEAADTPAG